MILYKSEKEPAQARQLLRVCLRPDGLRQHGGEHLSRLVPRQEAQGGHGGQQGVQGGNSIDTLDFGQTFVHIFLAIFGHISFWSHFWANFTLPFSHRFVEYKDNCFFFEKNLNCYVLLS